MTTKSIQVRMDPKLKMEVEKLLEEIGMDVPTAVRVFFAKIVAFGGIPFSLKMDDFEFTVAQTSALDRLAMQAKKGKGLSKRFASVDHLLDDLKK